jgi:hypothetical protein
VLSERGWVVVGGAMVWHGVPGRASVKLAANWRDRGVVVDACCTDGVHSLDAIPPHQLHEGIRLAAAGRGALPMPAGYGSVFGNTHKTSQVLCVLPANQPLATPDQPTCQPTNRPTYPTTNPPN